MNQILGRNSVLSTGGTLNRVYPAGENVSVLDSLLYKELLWIMSGPDYPHIHMRKRLKTEQCEHHQCCAQRFIFGLHYSTYT